MGKKNTLLHFAIVTGLVAIACSFAEEKTNVSSRNDWYRDSCYNWFMTHHVIGTEEVGRDIDVEKITQLIKQQNPGYIGVHAKGPMGWALYPTEIGYVLPKLHVDLVDVFSKIAEKLDTPLLIYYSLGSDKEIEKRKPEWIRVGLDGKQYPYMSLSYLTEVKEKYLWPQICEIMIKYKPDAFWFDDTVFSVWPCFREETKEHFKKVTGSDAPGSVKSPVWDQYREMQRQAWRDLIDQTTNLVHAIDPNCLVSYNMAYTVWMPEKPDKDVDFTSMDLGHLREDISLVTRFTDTQGIPFEILLPIRIFFEEENEPLIKPLGQLKQDIAQVLANGGILGAWDQPSETTVFHPGHQERWIELSKWVHERKRWCHNTVSLPDASVLHIAESHYLPDEQFEKYPSCKSTKHFCYAHENIHIRGACYSLNRHHVHNSVIAGWRLIEGPVTAKLLVVEDPKVVPEDVSKAIGEFAQNGGTVLLTAMSVKESKIEELSGIKLCEPPRQVSVYNAITDNGPVKFKHKLYNVEALEADVIKTASPEDDKPGYPFLTMRNHGKGKIFYCSSPIFSSYSYTEMPEEIVECILGIVLPKDERKLLVKGSDCIEVSLRSKENLQVVHLVNKSAGDIEGIQHKKRARNIPAAPASRLSLRLKQKPVSVCLEPGSREVSWNYQKGRVEIDVPTFEMYEIVAVTLSEG